MSRKMNSRERAGCARELTRERIAVRRRPTSMTPAPTEPGNGKQLRSSAGTLDHETVEADPSSTLTPASRGLNVAVRVGLEQMRERLGLGAPRRPCVGRDGRFELISCLGRGGMGEVYLAWDTVLEREVALKVVAAKYRHSPHSRVRLMREARSLAKLAHPNVLEVYDLETLDSGELIVAVAYIAGQTLERWQAGHSLRELLHVYLEAGRGLAAAHAARIIHRDFKPSNVLIADGTGRVVVGDFGLAAEIRSDHLELGEVVQPRSDLFETSPGALLGTPAFMAPELLVGQVASIASDQYAFCVSLWEASTGELPFRTWDRESLPPRPRDMPRWLYRVMKRGLAVAADDRFADMDALLQELQRGLRRRDVVLAGLAAVLVSSALAVSWWPRTPLEPVAPLDPCATADEPIDSVWDEQRRESLTAQLTRLQNDDPHLSNYVTTALDESAQRWRERATTTCETLQQDPANAEALANRACQERWLARFARRVELLAAPSEDVIRHVDGLLEPLRSIEQSCSVPAPALHPSVQTKLDLVDDHRRMRNYDEAVREAEQAAKLADELAAACVPGGKHSHENAEVYLHLAEIHADREQAREARAALEVAVLEGLGCSHHELLARAWLLESKLLSYDLEQPEDSARALARAESIIETLPSAAMAVHQGDLSMAQGLLALARGNPAQAIEHYRVALSMLGDDNLALARRAKLLANIGAAEQMQGHDAEARASYGHAAEIVAESLGSNHGESIARLATMLLNDALIGDSVEVLAQLEQLAPGLDTALRIKAHVVLSRRYHELEQFERATEYARVLADELESVTDLSPRVEAEARSEAGSRLLEHDPGTSVVMLSRALELWSSLGDEANQNAIESIYAKVLLDKERPSEALVHANNVLGREPSAEVRNFAQSIADLAKRQVE
jgi:serine/threonine protein kinase